jgi:hypothetical protein
LPIEKERSIPKLRKEQERKDPKRLGKERKGKEGREATGGDILGVEIETAAVCSQKTQLRETRILAGGQRTARITRDGSGVGNNESGCILVAAATAA